MEHQLRSTISNATWRWLRAYAPLRILCGDGRNTNVFSSQTTPGASWAAPPNSQMALRWCGENSLSRPWCSSSLSLLRSSPGVVLPKISQDLYTAEAHRLELFWPSASSNIQPGSFGWRFIPSFPKLRSLECWTVESPKDFVDLYSPIVLIVCRQLINFELCGQFLPRQIPLAMAHPLGLFLGLRTVAPQLEASRPASQS